MNDVETLYGKLKGALVAANECSNLLGRLLLEAKNSGASGPALFDRIATANKVCNSKTESYISAYKEYYLQF